MLHTTDQCPQCALDIDAVQCRREHVGHHTGDFRYLVLHADESDQWELTMRCQPQSNDHRDVHRALTGLMGYAAEAAVVAHWLTVFTDLCNVAEWTEEQHDLAHTAAMHLDFEFRFAW